MPTLLSTSAPLDRRVLSFRSIQRAIGLLAMSLPVILVLGAMLSGHEQWVQPSISHYYFTSVRELFVGILFAVSLFLLTYWGYDNFDRRLSLAAGILCLGIAIFPTNLMSCLPDQHAVVSIYAIDANPVLHYVCAVSFFAILAFMML